MLESFWLVEKFVKNTSEMKREFSYFYLQNISMEKNRVKPKLQQWMRKRKEMVIIWRKITVILLYMENRILRFLLRLQASTAAIFLIFLALPLLGIVVQNIINCKLKVKCSILNVKSINRVFSFFLVKSLHWDKKMTTFFFGKLSKNFIIFLLDVTFLLYLCFCAIPIPGLSHIMKQ